MGGVCCHCCHAGPNLPYYTRNLTNLQAGATTATAGAADNSEQQQVPLVITGLEPNPAMWQYAQASAEQTGLSQQQLQLVAGDAQQMPFEQDTFNAAVMTLVGWWQLYTSSCSFPCRPLSAAQCITLMPYAHSRLASVLPGCQECSWVRLVLHEAA